MHDRMFRWLLRVLPEEFRDGYAREIERTFRDEAREMRGGGRRWALIGLWLATMADVVRSAPGQHLDILWRDLRFATRAMLARPAHTLTAIVTLAIGIGANVAMFAVVDGVLLAPLDYRDADRLVAVAETKQGQDPVNMGYLSFVDLKSAGAQRQPSGGGHPVDRDLQRRRPGRRAGQRDARLARLLRHGRRAADPRPGLHRRRGHAGRGAAGGDPERRAVAPPLRRRSRRDRPAGRHQRHPARDRRA